MGASWQPCRGITADKQVGLPLVLLAWEGLVSEDKQVQSERPFCKFIEQTLIIG